MTKLSYLLIAVSFLLLPSQAMADCIVAKDAAGKYTHMCDSYHHDSFQVPSAIGADMLDTQESDTRSFDFGRDDSYMYDFGNDTVPASIDFGADDNPGSSFDY